MQYKVFREMMPVGDGDNYYLTEGGFGGSGSQLEWVKE